MVSRPARPGTAVARVWPLQRRATPLAGFPADRHDGRPNMKLHHLLPIAALLGALLPAQGRPQPSQDDLKQKRTEKLAKPVFQKAPWVHDYDQAREQAKKEGKLIFAYFTRSYAA